MTSEGSSSPSSQSLIALQRGKACISCRRRKVRCDGVRPACGQCIRGHRPDDCEYTDNQVKSRTHMLEEDIARLQARIQELEHPENTTPGIALHDPYPLPGVSQGSSAVFDFYLPSSIPSASSPGAQDEPPRYILLESLNKIIPYADEFGFFLHVPRVRASLEVAAGDSIPPALQSAIILISLLTQAQQQSALEQTLISTSLRQLADIIPLCSTSTRNLLHVIQTEVLLTFYLSRVGRIVEAKYHLGAAASLALAFRLHASFPSEGDLHVPANMQSMLADMFRTAPPQPVDQIERTEVIHGFWTIFTRDKCVSAILGVPPSISRSIKITIPWPGRIQEVNSFNEGIHLIDNMVQEDTIQNFLNGVSNDEDSSSALAYHAKALVLFDKVNGLVEQYMSDPRVQEIQSFRAEFAQLDILIEDLHASIVSNSFAAPSSLQSPQSYRFVSSFSIYVQSIACLATIHLHSPFREYYGPSNAKCVTAAMRIARALQGVDIDILQFNPCITIWINASFVIHAEITRLRTLQATHFSFRDEEEFVRALKIILDVLRGMVDRCPVLIFRRKLEAVLPLLEYLGPD